LIFRSEFVVETELNLTWQERRALDEISRKTGKARGQLTQEAVSHFIAAFNKEDRLRLLQRARGIWSQRDDLPGLFRLRPELDHH
jgi:hypothetical protein